MLNIRDAEVIFVPPGGGAPVHALDRVTFDIEPSSIVVALGASGCGKSTLLNAIAGFLPLTSGSIVLDGSPIERPGADRGVVFQKDTLLPWSNVLENVALGLKFRGMGRRERHAQARELLRLVGLEPFAASQPYELSGGMRQRVGIARALATDPRILLMDEPFGALDSLTRESMQELLVRVWAATAKQVFFITHSIEEALLLGTTVIVMSPRPGRIIARFELDFVRKLAAGADLGAVQAEPRFAAMRQEIRSLIHASGTLQ